MKSFSTFLEEKQTELFNKYGIIFAFSNEQFNKKKKENMEYVRIITNGMYCPKENAEIFSNEYNQMYEEQKLKYLETYSKEEIIRYELANHGAFYTYDLEDAYYAVKDFGFTADDVINVFNKEKKNYY